VEGLREEIYECKGFEAIASLDKRGCVARERCRVASDNGEEAWLQTQKIPYIALAKSSARRIGEDKIRRVRLVVQEIFHRAAAGVKRQACPLRIELEVIGGSESAFHGRH
jgi:hypothetical protein